MTFSFFVTALNEGLLRTSLTVCEETGLEIMVLMCLVARTALAAFPVVIWVMIECVRALARLDLFPFLSPFSLYGLSYCMPELTSLTSYCALS